MFRSERRRVARALFGASALAFSSARAAAAEAAPRPLWSFHAGAPLSGPPAVGPEGSVALGTVDGYVHVLRTDGVFRYSYTVNGRVFASPLVLRDGLVLVASDKARLYALRPDGSLAWEAAVAGGVASPLALDAQERVWLRTGSGTTIAMSRRGGVVAFAKIARTVTLGPVPLPGGGVVVGSPAGEIRLIGDFGRFRRISVTPGPSSLFPSAPGFVALASTTLTEYGAELDARWNRSGVDAVLCTSPLVTAEARELRWLAADGAVAASASAPNAVKAPSACTAASVFAVDDSGSLVQARRDGQVTRIDAPGGAFVGLDASRPGSLLASYRDGRVIALKAVP